MRKNVAGQKVTFSLFKAGARIANPTIAAGDFKVDLDGAGQVNVATPPTSDAAGLVMWSPSQAETNGNVVTLLGLDAVGAEWEPLTISFDTAAETAIITNLDAAVSTRSTLAQADILSDATPFAGGNVDAAISTRGTANAGDAMALTVGERTTLAGVVWTYATRTLTSISAFLASIAAAVWGYATRTLTSSSTAPGVGLTAQAWTVLRGDTLTRTFATIAADPTITRCRLTVKRRYEDTDNEAILAVDSTSGLLRLNGAAPGAYTATFTVATGVLSVPAATMAQLDPRGYRYDVQVWRGAVVQTIERGGFVLTEDYTMAV